MLIAEVLAEKQAELQSLNRNERRPSLELNNHPPQVGPVTEAWSVTEMPHGLEWERRQDSPAPRAENSIKI